MGVLLRLRQSAEVLPTIRAIYVPNNICTRRKFSGVSMPAGANGAFGCTKDLPATSSSICNLRIYDAALAAAAARLHSRLNIIDILTDRRRCRPQEVFAIALKVAGDESPAFFVTELRKRPLKLCSAGAGRGAACYMK
jgi:hypothetical protein